MDREKDDKVVFDEVTAWSREGDLFDEDNVTPAMRRTGVLNDSLDDKL